MVKKAKAKASKKSVKAKKAKKFVCDACGMVVAVEEPCACDPCDITCCGQDMRALSCC